MQAARLAARADPRAHWLADCLSHCSARVQRLHVCVQEWRGRMQCNSTPATNTVLKSLDL